VHGTDGALLSDTVCRCAEVFLFTGSFGMLECVASASINAAFTSGMIDERQHEHGLAARDLFIAASSIWSTS